MANKQIRETFNDGLLEYGLYKTQRNAARKVLGKTFERVGALFYRELALRESDHSQYGAAGTSLDLKVKTLAPPNLRISKDDMMVKINEQMYSIIWVDSDKKTYLYFYLHAIEGEKDERNSQSSDGQIK